MEWLELGILDKINRIYKIRERRGVNELGVNGGVFVAAVYDRPGCCDLRMP